MQNMHEFLKIKHGHEHGHVQNIHMLFVTEAERRLQALFPAPKGLHTHCPLPLEVPELKILKITTTPNQLTGILPIITHFIYSHFFYVPPSLDICIFSYLKRSFSKFTTNISQFSSVQFSHSVVSNSLRPHGLQHTRPPCPSPTPRVYSNSYPLSR